MGKYRVVFHLNEGDKVCADLVLGDLANLLANLKPEALEAELVANAGGIEFDDSHLVQVWSYRAR